MPGEFQYDLFLIHSAKDKAVVCPLAERLRADGLKVWFDEWVLKPGDSITAKINPPSLRSYGEPSERFGRSRVLACAAVAPGRRRMLCMSANAFGSDPDCSGLEIGTFRFRELLNQERRFIPLRFDDAPIKGSLAQYLYINWHQNLLPLS